jgi:hypothetical protein
MRNSSKMTRTSSSALLLLLFLFSCILGATAAQYSITPDRPAASYFKTFKVSLNGDAHEFNVTLSQLRSHYERRQASILFCERLGQQSSSQGCVVRILERLDNAHLGLYLDVVGKLHERIATAGIDPTLIEGNSGFHIEGVKAKRKVVDESFADPTLSGTGINNVCEVGFNAGHAVLLWLMSNPHLKQVIAFDIGTNPYVQIAFDFINKLFPSRVKLILGDSMLTLPNFVRENKAFACDLLYVDGGHHLDVLVLSDMLNGLLLSSNSRLLGGAHIILDDVNIGNDQT